jgi:hypothetical protein
MVDIIALSHKVTMKIPKKNLRKSPQKTHTTHSLKLQSLFPFTPPHPHKRAPKGSHKDPPSLKRNKTHMNCQTNGATFLFHEKS